MTSVSADRFRARAISKPKYRGVLHSWCAVLFIPLGVVLVATAPSARAAVAAWVFAFSAWFVFYASTLFHRTEYDDHGWYRFRRVDHTAIYLCIAGTSTPLGMLALHGWARWVLLLSTWIGASLGIVLRWTFFHPPFGSMNASFIMLGWAPVATSFELYRAVGGTATLLIALGGALYTVGALVVGSQWPDPWPATFGYHEIWHVMVVLALSLHYFVVAFYVLR